MDWLQDPLEQLQWALLHWIAGLLWAADRLLLIGGVLIHSLRKWVTDPGGLITLVLTQLLQDPAGSQLIKTYLAGGVMLGLLLTAGWFFLRPLLGANAPAPADVRKIFLWLALAGWIFSNGPAFASDLERFRAQLSSGAYQVAITVNSQVSGRGYNNTGGEVPITGSQPFSPTLALFPQTTHIYGIGNPPEYTGIDVAAAFLLANQEDINGTANGGTGLPGGAEFAFFTSCDTGGQTCAQPWPSGYDEPNRQAALAKALNGVIRMATGIVPCLFAVLQAFIFLALALAAAILFFSLPLALVFAFFNTTEVIALSVMRGYIGLLVKTYVTGVVLALFMGFLLAWGGGNWVAFLGISLVTLFFTSHLARMSVQTITGSLNVVTQAMGAAMGTRQPVFDPIGTAGQAVGLGTSVALAAATGGSSLAAGVLVSGGGGMLGLPGAGTLGTAIALGARRRVGTGSQEELAAAQPAPSPNLDGGTFSHSPTLDGEQSGDQPRPMTSPSSSDPAADVIEGEWYEIAASRKRHERANHWLLAQGIAPLPMETDRPFASPPPPVSPIPPPTSAPLVLAQLPLLPEKAAPPSMPIPDKGWMVEPGQPPAALNDYAQWINWRYETRRGQPTKIPYNPISSARARTNDPASWGTLEAATEATAQHSYDGVGFMLAPDDPFVGIDLDHCYDPATGIIDPWAEALVRELDSYTEVTPSGTGLRIFVRGQLPPRELGRKRGPVEMYDDRRFLTVTGQHLQGTPISIEDRAAAIGEVHTRVFQDRPAAPTLSNPSAEPSAVNLSDAAVLTKIQNAQNHEAFARLWGGDTAGYASESEADLALCGMLSFYTQDPVQIERIVAQSALWDEKWQNRPAYRQGTIQTAIAHRTGTYTGQRPSSGTRPGPVRSTAPPEDHHGEIPNRVDTADTGNEDGTPTSIAEDKNEEQ